MMLSVGDRISTTFQVWENSSFVSTSGIERLNEEGAAILGQAKGPGKGGRTKGVGATDTREGHLVFVEPRWRRSLKQQMFSGSSFELPRPLIYSADGTPSQAPFQAA